MAKTIEQSTTFEQAYSALQSIVTELENPQITLEDSIQKYEDGMAYFRFCEEKLIDAQQRVQVVDENAQEAIVRERLSAPPTYSDPDEEYDELNMQSLESAMPPDRDDEAPLSAADFAEADGLDWS